MQTVYATEESERLSVSHHMARRRAESAQQRAYSGLEAARRAAGVARIVMGVHLVSLHDSDGWQGRTGAKSFRRFLLEDGIEPKAAHQYMTVARAFVLEHGVSPEAIALVGMRVLVDAAQYLRPDDPMNQVESNVDDIVALVTSMPSAAWIDTTPEAVRIDEPSAIRTAPSGASKPSMTPLPDCSAAWISRSPPMDRKVV